jgi:hypothetical protein
LHGSVRGLLENPAITSARKSDDSSVEICCGAVKESPAIVRLEKERRARRSRAPYHFMLDRVRV